MQLTLETGDLYHLLVTSTFLFVFFSYLCFRVLFKFLDYEFGKRRLDQYESLLGRLCTRLIDVPDNIREVGRVCTTALPGVLKTLCDRTGFEPLKGIISAVTETTFSPNVVDTQIRPTLTEDCCQEARDEAVIRSEYNAASMNRLPRDYQRFDGCFADTEPTHDHINRFLKEEFLRGGQRNQQQRECPVYSYLVPSLRQFVLPFLTAAAPLIGYFVAQKFRDLTSFVNIPVPTNEETPKKQAEPHVHKGWAEVLDKCKRLCNPNVEVNIDDETRKNICDFYRRYIGTKTGEPTTLLDVNAQIQLCELVSRYWSPIPNPNIIEYVEFLQKRRESLTTSTSAEPGVAVNGSNTVDTSRVAEVANQAQNIMLTLLKSMNAKPPTDSRVPPTSPEPETETNKTPDSPKLSDSQSWEDE